MVRSSILTEYRSTTVSLTTILHGFSAGFFPRDFARGSAAPAGAAVCASSGTSRETFIPPPAERRTSTDPFAVAIPPIVISLLTGSILGILHGELGKHEKLLLLLPLTKAKVRYGRSHPGEPEFGPLLPLDEAVAGSRVEGPAVDIEPHRVHEVRRILLQDHLCEGDRPFRREGGKGQATLQLERLPRFGRKGHQGVGLLPFRGAEAVHVDPEISQRGPERRTARRVGEAYLPPGQTDGIDGEDLLRRPRRLFRSDRVPFGLNFIFLLYFEDLKIKDSTFHYDPWRRRFRGPAPAGPPGGNRVRQGPKGRSPPSPWGGGPSGSCPCP